MQSAGVLQVSVKQGVGGQVPHAFVVPSSMVPSQSSSAPLQTSTGSGSHAPQRFETPSSTRPSQSLSAPSQTSTGLQNPQPFEPEA